MQKFSFHTHTSGFDGQNTEAEMVETAIKLGWEKIGFSNHFIVYSGIENTKMYAYAKQGEYNSIYSSTFEEAIDKFIAHYATIDRLKKETGFPIYKGMEVDFFAHPSWREGFEKAVTILKPDYTIGSAHFIEYQNTLYNAHDLKNASPEEQKLLLHRYWQNVRAAASSNLFDFLAHLDLMKKTGLGLGSEWMKEEKATVRTIATAGAKVEINTSGYKFSPTDPYPGRRILKMLATYHVPILINDDAHKKSALGASFDKAEALARQIGLEVLTFPRQNPKTPFINHGNNQILI